MSEQARTSRRQMLKALGVAGLAASAGDVFVLTSFGGPGRGDASPTHMLQGQTGTLKPTPASATDPMVTRAVQAAQSAQLGGKRVALQLSRSTPYRSVYEFPLTQGPSRKGGGATGVEAVTLAIADDASTKALRDRLTQLKMHASQNQRVFYFVRARQIVRGSESEEFNFILGLALVPAEGIKATVMRVDDSTKLPGWTTASHFMGSGQPQGGVSVASSAAGGGGEEQEDEDFSKCYINALASFIPKAAPLIGGSCGECGANFAASPPTAGTKEMAAIPSCLVCAATLGVVFAVPLAFCLDQP